MRKTVLLIICLCWWLTGAAQTVSVSEAYQKAQAFMGEKGKQVAANAHRAPGTHGQEAAAYYVFNATGDGGFVLVSGDSRVGDILGYCDEGSFNEEQLPDNMRAWLQGYADQIEALRQGRKVVPAQVPTHAAINPMITSRWDQGSSQGDAYNRQCPKIDGKYCMTGCVATSMAQVMRYHRWPKSSTKKIPSYESNETLGTLSALSARTFDWDNMLDTYQGGESTTQMNAVAWLMRYCGQAVKMDYGTKSSAAYSDDVAMALREYFGYDVNTRYVVRLDYSAAGWDNLIYNELKNSRPVCYNGSSTGGGHSFVCDGYDGKGFYHINWGWGGNHDGYYKITLLNPDGGGTGSSGTEDGYTMNHGAVVGIQKDTSFDDDKRILTLADFSYSGSTINAIYWNRTGMSGTFQYGLVYQNVNNTDGTFQLRYQTDDFNQFVQRTYSDDVNTMNLADGTYRFYPFSRIDGSDWYRMQGDYETYIEVVMKNGQKQSMSRHPKGNLHVKSVTCTGNKIVGMPQEVKITVSNTGDEFNNVFYLFASKTNEKGEWISTTNMVIEAGATEEATLYFTPESTGTWNLWIDIDEMGENNIGPYQVTINSAPTGDSNLALTKYTIDAISSGADIHATVKNNASQGYYRPVACAIFTPGSNTSIMVTKSGNLNLAAGKTVNLDFHVEGLTSGKQYYAMLALYPQHTATSLAVFGNRMYFVPTVTGIDQITTDPTPMEEGGDYYTLDGRKLDKRPTQKGVYIVNGKKMVIK
ncbi:MAG: C10 family peptidase [Prevotella sp.]|nr:C10 family peptidase [Prevotella sp.]